MLSDTTLTSKLRLRVQGAQERNAASREHPHGWDELKYEIVPWSSGELNAIEPTRRERDHRTGQDG